MDGLWLFLFLVIFAAVMFAASFGFKLIETERKKKIKQTLKTVAPEKVRVESRILLEEYSGDASPVTRWLARYRFFERVKNTIESAGLRWSIEGLAVRMLAGAAIGALIGWQVPVFVFSAWSIAVLGVVLGLMPWLYVKRKRTKRLAAFEDQFPEALDFLARAVRAGHAFSIAIEMLANEASDPIRTEFRKVYSEMNLGATLEAALRNLMKRIPTLDVRFFVSAVLLQKETGGNLAEILMKLAYIIRERFRLKGQVRALSAHGRMTAAVVSGVPVALLIGLSIIAPDYLASMARDPHGKWMIGYAIAGQFIGYYLMHRIINIKV